MAFSLVAMMMLPLVASAHVMDGAWHAIEVDERPVDAWVPACAATQSPIILSLHAWATSKEMEKRVDRLVDYAGSECAVIVYPEGNLSAEFVPKIISGGGLSWNAGGCCPNANLKHVDDVTFLDHVIVAVAKEFHVNEQLTFVVGISNGGMMANRLACTNDKIKALVAVSGPLINGSGTDTETFTCDRSVPMLHFHGDADLIVPYDGCDGIVCKAMAALPGFPKLPWPTVPGAVADWRARNGISASATENTTTFTNGSTTCSSWGNVANNVTLCKIGGEGHAWPGSCSFASIMPGMHCSLDMDASAEVMRFFRQYTTAASQVLV